MISTRPRPHAESGFSLLELMAAITIFSLIVVGFVQARNRSIDQAGQANDTRLLRYLASHQMGHLLLGFDPGGNEYEVGEHGGSFGELDERYASFVWSASIEEFVVAGQSEDDDIPSLFSDEDDEFVEEEEEEEPGEPVLIHRITLEVRHEDAQEGIKLTTFKTPPAKGDEEGEGGSGG
jgi:prepilin-type N-terminal cleavage/methylation domain-containing protein